jgi:hypothetical protein
MGLVKNRSGADAHPGSEMPVNRCLAPKCAAGRARKARTPHFFGGMMIRGDHRHPRLARDAPVAHKVSPLTTRRISPRTSPCCPIGQ